MTFEWIRFSAASLLTLAGLFTVFTAILGTYRFKFALNRMHSASMADTLGMFLIMLALVIAYGFDAASLKLVLIVAFMWVASPVSSHLVAELEVLTDPELKKHLAVEDRTAGKGHENGDI